MASVALRPKHMPLHQLLLAGFSKTEAANALGISIGVVYQYTSEIRKLYDGQGVAIPEALEPWGAKREKISRAADMVECGSKVRDVAELYSVTQQAVYNELKRRGWKRTPVVDDAEVLRLLAHDFTTKEIAEMVECSEGSIKNAYLRLKAAGHDIGVGSRKRNGLAMLADGVDEYIVAGTLGVELQTVKRWIREER